MLDLLKKPEMWFGGLIALFLVGMILQDVGRSSHSPRLEDLGTLLTVPGALAMILFAILFVGTACWEIILKIRRRKR